MHPVPRLYHYSIILVDGELIKHTHTQVRWSASAGSGGVALTTVRLVSPRRQELSSRVVPVPAKAPRLNQGQGEGQKGEARDLEQAGRPIMQPRRTEAGREH